MAEMPKIDELRELVARKLAAEETLTMEEAKQCVEALRAERAEAANKTTRRRSAKPKADVSPLDLLNQVITEAI